MKIRIKSSCLIGYWYADKIGKVFNVGEINRSEQRYPVITGEFLGRKINIEDAEAVEEVEKSCEKCGDQYCGHAKTNSNSYLNCKYWEPIEQAEEKKDCTNCINDPHECILIGNDCNNFNKWKQMEKIKRETGSAQEAKHYMTGEYQPILIMQDKLTNDQFIGYLLGNVIKYSLRMNHKNQSRSDAGKCWQYIKWLCDVMDGKKITLEDY